MGPSHHTAQPRQDRRETNPLFGPNRLKLGVFGLNGPGTTMTRHPDRHDPTWEGSLAIAQRIDEAGLEAIVPYSRWHPFGDIDHYTANILDPFIWAGALAAKTRHASIFSTMHMNINHPVMAAKQAATIDRIAKGRFSLNVVVGWFQPEMDMFGGKPLSKTEGYDYGDEWIEIVQRLWTADQAFDFEGKYLRVVDASCRPQPVQRPMPPLMNAGSSPRGREFASRHADVAFIVIPDTAPAAVRAQVDSYKQYAKAQHGRDIQVWSHALVIQRESEAAAQAAFRFYTQEHGDEAAVDLFVQYQIGNHSQTAPEMLKNIRTAVAGGGGVQLFGTAEQIAERLQSLSDSGVDGILLTFVDYDAGSASFVQTVLPLLEQAGLRQPFVG